MRDDARKIAKYESKFDNQTQCDYQVFATKKKADKRWDWIDRAFNFCKDELVGVGGR